VNYQNRYLDWDSNFYGKKIYCIDIESEFETEAIIEYASKLDFDLVYLFSKEKLNISDSNNFFLADEKVIFYKEIKQSNLVDKLDNHIFSTSNLTDSLLELALISGSFSRFNIDKNLQPKFKKLYSTWIEKSISRELASDVLVYKIENKEVGFITVKKKEKNGVIGLVAVNPVYHGRSIGSSLINSIENWCLKNDVLELEVATQLSNKQACAFYKKNEFVIKQVQYIYHYYK
jgi:dTDP-4-amino-4,6-dideoxy-D-galactose acyltransferase